MGKIHLKYWYKQKYDFSVGALYTSCGNGNYENVLKEIDDEIESAYANAKNIVAEHRDTLHKVSLGKHSKYIMLQQRVIKTDFQITT